LLLYSVVEGSATRHARQWLAAGLLTVTALTLYNLWTIRNRAEDFKSRIAISGRNVYRYANPISVKNGVAFTEMQPSRYGVGIIAGKEVYEVPTSTDALSIAGSQKGDFLCAELAGQRSVLVKIPVGRIGTMPEALTEGQDPALSPSGKWLAFIRENHGSRTAWLLSTDSPNGPQIVLASSYQPLDVTVTDQGDVIAAAGNVSDPHLLLVRHEAREVQQLLVFLHPVRYPAISPDGKRLAFSRRERGSWHLFVRTLETRDEQQLTHAFCNAISPSWEDNHTLLYASDCGRGVGLSALARVVLPINQ